MQFELLSLLPPLLAILLALLTRNVIPALFCGVWLGATMLNGWNPATGLCRHAVRAAIILSDSGCGLRQAAGLFSNHKIGMFSHPIFNPVPQSK